MLNYQCIDFRVINQFPEQLQGLKSLIYYYIRNSDFSALALMDDFYFQLKKYYHDCGKYQGESALFRAHEVHSEFIQNLFYYTMHVNTDRDFVTRFLLALIRQEDIFYSNYLTNSPRITFWVDPKEGYTALTSVCRNGYLIVAQALLDHLAEKTGGVKTKSFQWFISHTSRLGFSPLSSACAGGHIDIVELLLNSAVLSFGGGTPEYKEFLEQKNSFEQTPRDVACFFGQTYITLLLERHGAESRHRHPVTKRNSDAVYHGEVGLFKKPRHLSTPRTVTVIALPRRVVSLA